MPFKTGNWGIQAKERSVRRKEYFRNYKKQSYGKRRDEMLLKMKQYYCQHSEEYKARNLAKQYIKIPQGQLCEECNIALAVQRHHSDYSKPFEVRFLCVSCHIKENKKRKQQSEVIKWVN